MKPQAIARKLQRRRMAHAKLSFTDAKKQQRLQTGGYKCPGSRNVKSG